MALAAGAHLGPYEIVAPLGAGGMGEVYRAHDAKLGRDVALKILPESVVHDPDRIARFRREGQVLAALNHPHIAVIYGLEDGADVHALVMELVEGPTLADRIARGPIPLDEALPIARQIAEALEAAHDQGIIHRDLKPANIKLREDGTAKVLDFGLAKAMEPATSTSPGLSRSPTITTPAMTQAGMILGTVAYMSPEQARGKAVDRRGDIWAFGCVLYEMVTGTRAFPGDDVTDTIVAVISKEPDWHALPPAAAVVRPLLVRCLKKDPKTRMRDIGEARLQIDDLITGSRDATAVQGEAADTATSSRRVWPSAAAALAVGAFALGAFVTWIAERPSAPASVVPVRFNLVLPDSRPFATTAGGRELAISSGGTHLAYIAGPVVGVTAGLGGQLVVRAVNELDVTPLRGITAARSPFLSPDGKWIGYSEGYTDLRKVSITGGPPITLCRTGTALRGATWGEDDTIVFATADPDTGLLRVAAAGGDVKVLTKPDRGRGEADHVFPSILPGSRAVLFTILPQVGMMDSAQIAVLDLESGRTKVLIRGGSSAEFVRASVTGPSAASGEPGYLIYAVPNSLRAVRFDPVKLEVLSDPVPLLEQVATSVGTGAAQFAVSRSGILVYVTGGVNAVIGGTGQMRPLVWVDRHGKEESIAAPSHDYASLRLSPDDTRVALDARDQQSDIWVFDFARKTLTRLTTDPRIDGFPIWTPDGKRMIFESSRTGTFNVYMQAADGPGAVEQLTKSTNQLWPLSLTPDGTRLVIHSGSPFEGDLDLLPLDGKSQPVPLMRTPFNEDHAEVSPDGRWLAYQSNESGRPEVHVRPFPDVNAGHWQVSPAGGAKPVWARNGRELFYFSGQALMAVPVQTAPTFSAGIPAKLFEGPYYFADLLGRTYDVSRDGRRFVMIKNPPRLAAATSVGEVRGTGDQPSTTANMVVVVNWQEELKQRVPAK